mgnify:FL=1
MTKKLTDTELARSRLLKVARAAVRLKHSILADAELNEKLPALEAAFWTSVMRGELPDEATADLLVSEVFGGP